ncbi:uncharacterized protein LOC108022703 [Drosophila biarmipes]|uniref:uncharacterized protein LOC108022703 n=1 Tax=Drosophila biarmipes TaxID=125945 RepID=UPI0007E6DD67|nr:uncharacterized protein LOC108022703 [Drosophila biarmipes]
MKAAVGAAPLVVCLAVIISSAPTAANPLWSLDQVGDYFSGIFRSIVGPLFGFGPGSNSTAF